MRSLLHFDYTVATYNIITVDKVKQAYNVQWNNVYNIIIIGNTLQSPLHLSTV